MSGWTRTSFDFFERVWGVCTGCQLGPRDPASAAEVDFGGDRAKACRVSVRPATRLPGGTNGA